MSPPIGKTTRARKRELMERYLGWKKAIDNHQMAPVVTPHPRKPFTQRNRLKPLARVRSHFSICFADMICHSCLTAQEESENTPDTFSGLALLHTQFHDSTRHGPTPDPQPGDGDRESESAGGGAAPAFKNKTPP